MKHSLEGQMHFADCKALFTLNSTVFLSSAICILILYILKKAKKIGSRKAPRLILFGFSGSIYTYYNRCFSGNKFWWGIRDFSQIILSRQRKLDFWPRNRWNNTGATTGVFYELRHPYQRRYFNFFRSVAFISALQKTNRYGVTAFYPKSSQNRPFLWNKYLLLPSSYVILYICKRGELFGFIEASKKSY